MISDNEIAAKFARYCIECKFNRSGQYCCHPAVTDYSGFNTVSCVDLRKDRGTCGPEGMLFEAKPTSAELYREAMRPYDPFANTFPVGMSK